MEDDDKIKKLFDGFEPAGGSTDDAFMRRLRGSLDAVEHVRRDMAAERRRNRTAVVAAAIAGFASGLAAALLMPVLVRVAESLLPDSYATTAAWMAAAATTLTVAFSTYDIAQAWQRRGVRG
ncbi:MAG: hypothetical protein K2L74_01285 [Muribaculaceae bacterium]|nr:hypothetical protein [Muribaculaceae bacterium]